MTPQKVGIALMMLVCVAIFLYATLLLLTTPPHSHVG